MIQYYQMPHPPIVIPEIGHHESAKISKTFDAMQSVAKGIAHFKPDCIVVITPHGPSFSDAMAIATETQISGNLSQFTGKDQELHFEIQRDVALHIVREANKINITTVAINHKTAAQYKIPYALDHGAYIPLYFIHQHIQNVKIIHITYGFLSKAVLYGFGMLLQSTLTQFGLKTAIISSGDLSHRLLESGPYGKTAEGILFDKTIQDHLERGQILKILEMDYALCKKAGECGLRSLIVLFGAMDGHQVVGIKQSYESTFGVGYLVMTFVLKLKIESLYPLYKRNLSLKLSPILKNHSEYVTLAFQTLFQYVMFRNTSMPFHEMSSNLKATAQGVFVSIKINNTLRGCIGTIYPVTQIMATEIARNAIEASSKDPRFPPIQEDEVLNLQISVDVLEAPSPSSKAFLDYKNLGVIVSSGSKRGLLLPDLEGINSNETQLALALKKANIDADEAFQIETFRVTRYV